MAKNERMIRHLTMLEEGIAIFSKDKTVISHNSHFIQYIGHISNKLIYSAGSFFEIEAFKPIICFIDNSLAGGTIDLQNPPSLKINVIRHARIYAAKSIVYPDRSFEVILKDVTKTAKRQLLKQQITENIAHELKTPVSSISGFLEILLNHKMDKLKMLEFIQKAYLQTCRLTELINDISLITKIEKAGDLYSLERINLPMVITDIMDDFRLRIFENNIRVLLNIPKEAELNGNPILIDSIFRNLVENTITHAGKDVALNIHLYMEDQDFYYFSYFNTGTSVPDEHIPRLFERFYRVDKARSSSSGGPGLGLSIVKNAVIFHKGDITVKNREEGGLEFLFTLGKGMPLLQSSGV